MCNTPPMRNPHLRFCFYLNGDKNENVDDFKDGDKNKKVFSSPAPVPEEKKRTHSIEKEKRKKRKSARRHKLLKWRLKKKKKKSTRGASRDSSRIRDKCFREVKHFL